MKAANDSDSKREARLPPTTLTHPDNTVLTICSYCNLILFNLPARSTRRHSSSATLRLIAGVQATCGGARLSRCATSVPYCFLSHRIVIVSHRVVSYRYCYRIASHRVVIVSYSYRIRIVSVSSHEPLYRTVSYRIRIVSRSIVSHRIVSHRIVSYRIVSSRLHVSTSPRRPASPRSRSPRLHVHASPRRTASPRPTSPRLHLLASPRLHVSTSPRLHVSK